MTCCCRNRNELLRIIGNGSARAANALYEQVKHHKINIVDTDGNYAYNKVIPRNINEHIIDKTETCLIEVKNSSLRDMLARLTRKQDAIQKCQMMLNLAVIM